MRRFLLTTHFLLAILIVIASPAFAAAAEEEDKRTALGIFDAALAQFEKSRTALRKWQYHQTLTTFQFDSAGKIVAKGTWHSIVRPGDPRPFEYVSKNVEGKIAFFEEGAAEEDLKEKDRETTKEANKSERNQAESAVDAVRKYNLRDRYAWKCLPDDSAAGEPAYVIAFEPKPNQNTKTREERF